MRSFVILTFLLLFAPLVLAEDSKTEWQINLENGYISTAPLIIEDQVIVRTSGFWTGEDRPHVYSFDLYTGEENWRYRSASSTNHDLSPLLHVEEGSGDCGEWNDMIVVGWTDGKVTAHSLTNGDLLWSAQTEVVTWGITGAMALDSDLVVVPTRQGLSSFCLADGEENLRVDLPELGWRNGVTVTQDGYLLGNEEGVLNIISRDGNLTNQTIGEGMIRHAPVHTHAGILIHLQTESGSVITLDGESLFTDGQSPAIPLQIGEDVYLGTSEHILHMRCEENCTIVGWTSFHSNGELTPFTTNTGEQVVAFPQNTAGGGWAIGIPGDSYTLIHGDIGTYTTAGIAQDSSGNTAFGNDNGVLHVIANAPQEEETAPEEIGKTSFFLYYLIAAAGLTFIIYLMSASWGTAAKWGSVLLLVALIGGLPEISQDWSEQVEDLQPEAKGDWDDSWPESWKGTQVVVFELESGEVALGGLSGFETVEELIDHAAAELNITVEKENHELGAWIISFDGEAGEGWEFTIDGERAMVGMSQAEIGEGSVVRWSPA